MIKLGAQVTIRDREHTGTVIEIRQRLDAEPGYIVEVTSPVLDVIPIFGPFTESELAQ